MLYLHMLHLTISMKCTYLPKQSRTSQRSQDTVGSALKHQRKPKPEGSRQKLEAADTDLSGNMSGEFNPCV